MTIPRIQGHNGDLGELIQSHFPAGHRGYCLDVGASDGVTVSSTFLLEKKYNWTVLCVEPNPSFLERLTKHRVWIETSACAEQSGDFVPFHVHLDNEECFSGLRVIGHPRMHAQDGAPWREIRVPVTTVDLLMAKWQFPRLDCLCVDTEGTELDVLKGCDFARWKPKILVVESWDEVGPCDAYLAGLGYQKIGRTIDNYIWKRRNR